MFKSVSVQYCQEFPKHREDCKAKMATNFKDY